MGPNYPVYSSQPNRGQLPSMAAMGPMDLLPSSSVGPYYQRQQLQAHGRYLAGTEEGPAGPIEVQDDVTQPAWASNELEYLAEMDDVQGNGVFDPPGSHGNIHPDAGVFTARYSIPGYQARERPYGFSEVRDATTGRRVRVVPSGAVAIDSSAQIAYIEQGLYKPPRPLMNQMQGRSTAFKPTWNVMQNPQAIGDATSQPFTSTQMLIATAGVGAALGVLYALWGRKKR